MKSRYLALLICTGYILLALIYARAVPLLESSDEGAHFLYMHNMLADRALPIIESREAIAEEASLVKRWALESHQPPLYYLIGALLISPTQRSDIEEYLQPNPLIFLRGIVQDNRNKWLHPIAPTGDTATAIWLLRLYSLALSTGTLWLIYQSARLVLKSETRALTALMLVACIPTFINIGSSVNNDNLVTFLYAAGVYWSLSTWQQGISNRAIILISLILAAIALTKITGLTLFGVVYLALLIGVYRGHYPVRRAMIVVIATLSAAALLAGWWYLRNLILYGDPIASAATLTLWGREFARATESGDVLGEISRIWRSFWMMVGHLHQPVWGVAWGYVYVTVITVIGMIGLVIAILRRGGSKALPESVSASQGDPVGRPYTDHASKLNSQQATSTPPLRLRGGGWGVGSVGSITADALLLLTTVIALPLITLVVGTRTIDISYGRLLFPALTGFAILLVYGWSKLVGRFGILLILPLLALALLFPFTTLPDAYPRLTVIDNLPTEAVPVNISAGDLTIVGYQSQVETIAPDGELRFDLYLSGTNPDNPALFITVLDPITQTALATSAVYPGTAPMDELQPGVLYRAPLHITVPMTDEPLSPRQLRLQFGWQTVLETDYLPLTDANNAPVNALVLNSATLLDPRYTPPELASPSNAVFGDTIALESYTISETHDINCTNAECALLKPGDALGLSMVWRTLKPLPDDWILTVQMLDANGALVEQRDGDLPGYPANAWRSDARTLETRGWVIPLETPPGEYRIYLGWYRLSDLARLPAQGDGVANDLYPLPEVVWVTE